MKRLLLLLAMFQIPGAISVPYGYAPIVDAVQEDTQSSPVFSGDSISCSNGGHFKEQKPNEWFREECEGGKKWTCADKQRVLLTSEEGKHFCLKVQFD